MTKKTALKIGIGLGLLAIVLVFLGVNYVPEIFAQTAKDPAALNPRYYVGSDWIERHPAKVADPAYYVGSDWIERHPPMSARPEYYDNSDWIERHPSHYYDNSDWIERHPVQPDH